MAPFLNIWQVLPIWKEQAWTLWLQGEEKNQSVDVPKDGLTLKTRNTGLS